METKKNIARAAGFFYLLVIIFSILYMEYIPAQIIVWKNPEATFANLILHENLFRFGIVSGILVNLSFILLPFSLYFLLQQINKNYARLMVILAIISVPISYTYLADQVEILDILKDYKSLKEFEIDQAQLKVTSFYKSLFNGFFVLQIFWGLWLFPFGFLVFKSGFLPKILGVFLMLGCIAYLIDVFGGVIFSNYYDYVNTRLLILPASIGEIGICLWLLIVGVKDGVRF